MFWHRRKESNPRFRFWRPMRYHYTTPVWSCHCSNRAYFAQQALRSHQRCNLGGSISRHSGGSRNPGIPCIWKSRLSCPSMQRNHLKRNATTQAVVDYFVGNDNKRLSLWADPCQFTPGPRCRIAQVNRVHSSQSPIFPVVPAQRAQRFAVSFLAIARGGRAKRDYPDGLSHRPILGLTWSSSKYSGHGAVKSHAQH